MSGKAIVERLGLEVTEIEVDEAGMCVDIDATLTRCAEQPPESKVYRTYNPLAGAGRGATTFLLAAAPISGRRS